MRGLSPPPPPPFLHLCCVNYGHQKGNYHMCHEVCSSYTTQVVHTFQVCLPVSPHPQANIYNVCARWMLFKLSFRPKQKSRHEAKLGTGSYTLVDPA